MSEAKQKAYEATVDAVTAYMSDCKLNVAHSQGPDNVKKLIRAIYDGYVEIAEDALSK